MDFFFLEAHALMQNPPAHAGNTLDKNATVTIAQDHPRLRGEYNHIKIDGQEYLGSPPLARGIRTEEPRRAACQRITPRLRGEYHRNYPIPDEEKDRITPACAGNT